MIVFFYRARRASLGVPAFLILLGLYALSRAQETKTGGPSGYPDSVVVRSADGDRVILANREIWTRLYAQGYVSTATGAWKNTGLRLPFAPQHLRTFCFSPGTRWTLTDQDAQVWELVGTRFHRAPSVQHAKAKTQ